MTRMKKSITCRIVGAAFFVALVLSSPVIGEDAPTWVKLGGVTYGAKPDERGPIGGGEGYTDPVQGGDFTVRNLDALIDALRKAVG